MKKRPDMMVQTRSMKSSRLSDAAADQARIGPDVRGNQGEVPVERLDHQLVLAGEMMAERAARQPGARRDVDRCRRRVALGQQKVERRVDETRARRRGTLFLGAARLAGVRCMGRR